MYCCSRGNEFVPFESKRSWAEDKNDVCGRKTCITKKTQFWEPLKKCNITTFASLLKPLKLSKENQALKSVNIDRKYLADCL